jgi:peptidoglycan hydrolase-like protein with peptidoglycan-binding domain
MKRSVRRWLVTAGVLAAAGAMVYGQAGLAVAARTSPVTAKDVTARAAAAAPAAYVPPSKPPRYGQTGAAVKSMQRRLDQLHYYVGPVDGIYGPDTLQAVWAFMEVQGLKVTVKNEANPIGKAFLKDLVHPKGPYVLIRKHTPGNRVEINQTIQILVLYRNGKVALILHVSSGGRYYYPCPGDSSATCGPAITPDGNYHALSFDPGWVTVPLGTMYNPTFFIGTAYAIHGDVPVPWYPASHGCVRIWMDAATWFHKELRIGGSRPTPIYIRGTAPAYPDSN